MNDDCLQIEGGRPLFGSIQVAGAKNAALPMMAASILFDAPIELVDVPEVGDVRTLSLALARLGMRVDRDERGAMRIAAADLTPHEVEAELAGRMRASICLVGPLLARRGRAVISLPGGCELGPRPIDLHLAGLAALGAEIRVERNRIVATADRLRGASIDLGGPRGPTVTGTANIMSAAVLAEGTTIIRRAAREPEIVDLGRCLLAAGARIDGLGSSVITVEGVARLDQPVVHRILPDRIEAATYLVAALATRGRVTVHGARAEHQSPLLAALGRCGARWTIEPGAITVESCPSATRGAARPAMFDVTARPYPGLPTDAQPLLAALATTIDGVSRVRDRVFPHRFAYLEELARFGSGVRHVDQSVVIRGRRPLSAATVEAADLRGGAALVIAALAAEGTSHVLGRSHIDRGYQHLVAKLLALDGEVRSVSSAGVARPLAPAA